MSRHNDIPYCSLALNVSHTLKEISKYPIKNYYTTQSLAIKYNIGKIERMTIHVYGL